ncbi:hypothetical protein AB0F13_00820 [Streptomyces sp. NPDC026206]|uniref:hypothetical protein n=1 Tax=Streptomyces sp. NPDC026206 TaxID=3157089 RepID=UPI0033EA3810
MPNTVTLLLIILVGFITAFSLAVYGLATMPLLSIRRATMEVVLRSLAALAASAAIGMYAWGALHLSMDETAADMACKDAVGSARASDIDRYEASYIPLRFGCHVKSDGIHWVTRDGSTWTAVPGYVNPSVLVLVLTSITSAAVVALAPNRRLTDHQGHIT